MKLCVLLSLSKWKVHEEPTNTPEGPYGKESCSTDSLNPVGYAAFSEDVLGLPLA